MTEQKLETPHSARQDEIQPFLLESSGIRGRLLRLGPVADTILRRHDYPAPVASLLGEMLALTGALSSLMKYEGVFTAQAKGDGPVSLLVSDVTAEGDLRGYAAVDAERLAGLLDSGRDVGLEELMGEGYFAYTVDRGPGRERYQGIVALSGRTLADCLQHYFLQSDQVQSGILLAAERVEDSWRAGALILQRIPEAGPQEPPLSSVEDEDSWRRAMTLQVTCTRHELLDCTLSSHDLLFRLFHEEGVRVFDPRPVSAACRCSRRRLEQVLAAMPREDLASMTVDGVIEARCEFCSARYLFDEDALATLFEGLEPSH
jgi:molecular chaperone Hsp33